MIVGLLSAIVLSGCSTINDRYTMDYFSDDREIISQKTHHIILEADMMDQVEIDDAEWKKLVNQVKSIDIDADDNWNCDVWGTTPYRSQMVRGIMKFGESINFHDIDHENSKKIFGLFEEQTGNDLEEVLEMSRALKEDGVVEKIIGGYGITIEKRIDRYETTTEGKNKEYTQISITKPCMKLKDAAKQAWLEEICGEDLLFATISQGKEKKLYELSSPTFISDGGCYRENSMPVVNMQIITSDTGKVEKVRMLIEKGKTYGISLLEETTFGPLHRVITSVKGNIEDQEMIDDLISVLDGKSTHKKGKVGDLDYEIKGEKFNDHCDQAIVEMKF